MIDWLTSQNKEKSLASVLFTGALGMGTPVRGSALENVAARGVSLWALGMDTLSCRAAHGCWMKTHRRVCLCGRLGVG